MKVDLDVPRLRRLDEVVQDVALLLGQRRRLGRLIAQPLVERLVRRKARRGLNPDFAFAEQRAVQQSHRARAGVGRRLALPGGRVGLFHQVGRGGDGVDADPRHIVEQAFHAFALDVFGEYGDAEELHGLSVSREP